MEKRKIVYIDMDGVLVDFNSGVNKLDQDTLEKYKEHYDNVDGIFATMDPMPGAIAAYKTLFKKYEVWVLSKPPHHNPSAYTDKRNWVAKHLGEFHTSRLILSPAKQLSIGDYLVDDRAVNGFIGKQLLFGSTEFPDWNSVLKFFESI